MSTRFNPSRRGVLIGSALAIAAATVPVDVSLAEIPGRDLAVNKKPILHPDGRGFGCYDPYGDFTADKPIVTEHLFLPWEDVDLSGLPAADAYALERGRKVLVTIEPWSWAKDWNVTNAKLRKRILAGEYDENMRAICKVLATFKSPVTIRWAQEMENSTGRFSWQNWAPAAYIKAYRRMGEIARSMIPNVRLMWSPKGEKNLRDYYPGNDWVDVVGLSVFGLEAYDKKVYGAPRTFAESVKQGYDLAVGYGKPIWVAELGYEGSLPYLERWVTDVTKPDGLFPQLKEVVYFNDKEVWEWPYHLGLPDWRVIRNKQVYPARKSRA